MKVVLKYEIKGKEYEIPNSWETLTPKQFVFLAGLLSEYAQQKISVADVKLRFVIHVLDIDMSYVPPKHEDVIFQNLYILTSNITFIFSIKYDSKVWNQLSPETKKLAEKTEPMFLPHSPEARILQKQSYHFVIDAVFVKQLVPIISVRDRQYKAYTITTEANNLSTTLTAKQYVDASDELSRINEGTGSLSMLTAILYCPKPYSSEKAHGLVATYGKHLDRNTLEAVALNFQAFMLFLFQRTHFRLLWRKPKAGSTGKYTVGLANGLYNLSADGYGDLNTVYQYSALEYLELLYKKLLDTVVSMRSGGMDDTAIAEKTNLDINVVMDIK